MYNQNKSAVLIFQTAKRRLFYPTFFINYLDFLILFVNVLETTLSDFISF